MFQIYVLYHLLTYFLLSVSRRFLLLRGSSLNTLSGWRRIRPLLLEAPLETRYPFEMPESEPPPIAQLQMTQEPKRASDLMARRLITISEDDVIEHLEDHMRAFRFRHLPVVRGKIVVGLITYRDLLHASSSFLSEQAAERDALIHKVPAKRVMQTELVMVRPDSLLTDVARAMWDNKVGSVLVTEEDGTLLGIITEADFIRVSYHFLAERLAEEVDASQAGPPPAPSAKARDSEAPE